MTDWIERFCETAVLEDSYIVTLLHEFRCLSNEKEKQAYSEADIASFGDEAT